MSVTDSLVQLYLDIFQQHGEMALKSFCNLDVPKSVFLSKYETLPPIEEMPEKEKRDMKQFVILLFPQKTIPEKLEACKIIYTVGTLLND